MTDDHVDNLVDVDDVDDIDDIDDIGDEGTPPPERAPRRARGALLGAAMMGLQQALFDKPEEDTVIEIAASGDPPNIDVDGIDEPFGTQSRLVGPPLDQIKARRRAPGRPRRR